MRSAPLILGLGVALASGSAHADTTAHEKGVALFEEARRLIDAGNCDAARPKLEESLANEPSIGARLSIADCTEQSDPLVAWQNLKEAARLAFLRHDDRFDVAEKRAAALEPKLVRLHVVIPPATLDEPGFELRVDGAAVDRFLYRDGLIAVKPGKHVVEAYAPQQRWSDRVVADAGIPTTVTVALERDMCPAAPTPPTPVPAPVIGPREDAGSTQRVAGLIVGGAGVAGLALGTAFGVVTLNKKSALETSCGGNIGSCAATPGSLEADRESAKSVATVSTVSFIVGGVALAGGAALYLTAPKGAPASGRVRVAPAIGRNEGGLMMAGTW